MRKSTGSSFQAGLPARGDAAFSISSPLHAEMQVTAGRTRCLLFYIRLARGCAGVPCVPGVKGHRDVSEYIRLSGVKTFSHLLFGCHTVVVKAID